MNLVYLLVKSYQIIRQEHFQDMWIEMHLRRKQFAMFFQKAILLSYQVCATFFHLVRNRKHKIFNRCKITNILLDTNSVHDTEPTFHEQFYEFNYNLYVQETLLYPTNSDICILKTEQETRLDGRERMYRLLKLKELSAISSIIETVQYMVSR